MCTDHTYSTTTLKLVQLVLTKHIKLKSYYFSKRIYRDCLDLKLQTAGCNASGYTTTTRGLYMILEHTSTNTL